MILSSTQVSGDPQGNVITTLSSSASDLASNNDMSIATGATLAPSATEDQASETAPQDQNTSSNNTIQMAAFDSTDDFITTPQKSRTAPEAHASQQQGATSSYGQNVQPQRKHRLQTQHQPHQLKPLPAISSTSLFPDSYRRKTFPEETGKGSTKKVNTLQRQNTLNDSATQEIQRMKFNVLNKRENKKNKKLVLDEDKILIGHKVSEGHSNYETAHNMLTGIRVAVSRCSGIMQPLREQDFKATKKLSFDITGNELTPSSKYDFKFKDYAPNVFRELRELFGLDPADYLVSLTAKYVVSEVGSPGKSGSFFYYSRDYKFIIKTIHRAEHKTLRKILKNYHQHVKSNPNTLVSQFYGMHRLKMPLKISNQKRKVYFIVMNNLFPPNVERQKTYDLKGSLWKRETIVTNEIERPILKDVNWLNTNEKLELGPQKRHLLLLQVERDVHFLQKSNIMDYSLLLGMHDVTIGNSDRQSNKESRSRSATVHREEKTKLFYDDDHGFRSTDINNEPMNVIYYLGIIDCLTNYSYVKRLETFVKGFYQNRKEISAIPAGEYGERFLRFVTKDTLKSYHDSEAQYLDRPGTKEATVNTVEAPSKLEAPVKNTATKLSSVPAEEETTPEIDEDNSNSVVNQTTTKPLLLQSHVEVINSISETEVETSDLSKSTPSQLDTSNTLTNPIQQSQPCKTEYQTVTTETHIAEVNAYSDQKHLVYTEDQAPSLIDEKRQQYSLVS